jgi:hypothetical protein
MKLDTPIEGGQVRRISLPWGVVGMAILVLGVEVFVARHDEFTTLASAEHTFAYRAAGEARRYEILCFGDSQAKDGLVPSVVEARLGKRTINLAVAGSPAPSAYLLLRRALEHGARPAALLVDYHAWLLDIDPRDRISMYADLCSLGDSAELAWITKDAKLFGSLLLSGVFPSVKARETIRADIMAAFRGLRGATEDRHRRIVPPSRLNWVVNRGAQLMPRMAKAKHAEIKEFWDEIASYPQRWGCLPTNDVYVRKFFQLAADNHIPVFFLIPPRHPRVQANRERLGLDALYTEYVRNVIADYPNVTVVDARRSNYDPTVFIDSSHFDRQGACDFSEDVATAVATHLGSRDHHRSRWVDLPQYRPHPQPPTIQDLKESEIALGATSTSVRR